MKNKNKDILSDIKAAYFIGIGGIGMSAVALFFLKSGIFVAGYDKTPSPITENLEKNNAKIHFDDNIKLIPDKILNNNKENTAIIYTPAIPENHSELNFFKNNGYKLLKRSEILGIITSFSEKLVAVAGTHGKTSVSTVIAHIFKEAGKNFNAFLGGISKNYDSNLILSENPDKTEFAIAEADEYDRSFLKLFPHTAVITAIDEDHLDIYKDINDIKRTFEKFCEQINKKGNLIIKKGITLNKNTFPENVYTYSLNDNADYYAVNTETAETESRFDIVTPSGKIKNLRIKIPGKLNIENAVAAVAVADILGISSKKIKNALVSWKGVKRRFDYIVNNENTIYIDDYAHHPEELKAFISSVKNIYPDKKIKMIFQPHLYSRTRDFADMFAESLSMCDEVLLTEIYPARELPIKNVTSKIIFEKIKCKNKKIIKKQDILNHIKKEKNTVLLTAGAGNISDYVEKIKKILT